MNITHIVIHELEKESGKTRASLTLFDSAINSTDTRVINLITELNNRYRNRSETYGVFDKSNPTIFHSSFENYFKKNTEEAFIEFSKLSSKDLKTRIEGIAAAKGGYLIFVHYEHIRKYVGIFLVRNTVGVSFKKDIDGHKFNIADVQHIDFENLAMACRINLDAYQGEGIRYLSFINKKSDDMSHFFTRWISSTDTETNEEDTNNLYNLLHQVELPLDEETKTPIDIFILLDRVYTSIKSTPGRVVNIRNLSASLFGDADYLPNYIEENNIIINGEFKAHPRAIYKFIRVRAKADEVELSFPRTAYKKIVRFDERDPSQIIITSEKLVNEIKTMLERED